MRDGAVAGLPPPDDAAMLDAAFSDERVGLAVTEPGLAWFTPDGGTHWSRVDPSDVPTVGDVARAT